MNYNEQFTEEELKHEVWKDVGECKGYEEFKGLYEVSSLGRMRSKDKWVNCKSGEKRLVRGKLLKPQVTRGYIRFSLKNKNLHKLISVHRGVALAFLPNLANLPQVNHKDEIKSNNRVSNLEWCTAEYNNNYGTRNKRISIGVSKVVNQYDNQGRLLNTYDSPLEASKQFGGVWSDNNIRACCNGYNKSAYGYIWKYADED